MTVNWSILFSLVLQLASAVKYLKRQNVLDAVARIEGGPERFLGYDTSDPLQFSYYKSAGSRQRESKILILVLQLYF